MAGMPFAQHLAGALLDCVQITATLAVVTALSLLAFLAALLTPSFRGIPHLSAVAEEVGA